MAHRGGMSYRMEADPGQADPGQAGRGQRVGDVLVSLSAVTKRYGQAGSLLLTGSWLNLRWAARVDESGRPLARSRLRPEC